MKVSMRVCLMAAVAASALYAAPAFAQSKPIIGLITKTNTNPFFVKMREGAEAKAKEMGAELRSFAGKVDGDNQTQVEAVESLIAAGAKGIFGPGSPIPSAAREVLKQIRAARKA